MCKFTFRQTLMTSGSRPRPSLLKAETLCCRLCLVINIDQKKQNVDLLHYVGSQDEQNNNEPATENHDLTMPMEPELYNDVREFIENFMAESPTSSHELILAPTMTVEIIQVEKRVQWSARQQLHHVKSGGRDNTGKFVVRIKFKG